MVAEHAPAQMVDVEKDGFQEKIEPVSSNEVTQPTGQLHQKLKSRHMQMIAIGMHSIDTPNFN